MGVGEDTTVGAGVYVGIGDGAAEEVGSGGAIVVHAVNARATVDSATFSWKRSLAVNS